MQSKLKSVLFLSDIAYKAFVTIQVNVSIFRKLFLQLPRRLTTSSNTVPRYSFRSSHLKAIIKGALKHENVSKSFYSLVTNHGAFVIVALFEKCCKSLPPTFKKRYCFCYVFLSKPWLTDGALLLNIAQ